MTSSQLFSIIKNLKEKNKQFPDVELISKESNCTVSAVKKVLEYYVENGKLIKEGELYDFPKVKEEVEIKQAVSIMYYICRIIMGIVGISCILCSVRFTYNFNKLTMPSFWGFILSVSLIIFTSFCFTVRSFLREQGKITQGRLFILLYAMGIIYSIFTAVAGQYNDYLVNNEKTIQAQVNEKVSDEKISLLKSEKERLLLQIENCQKQVEAQQKIIDDLSTSPERKFEYNNTWKQTNSIMIEYMNRAENYQNRINEIDEQLIESSNTVQNKERNIYDWISELFHISGNLLQFIISLFPAVFIDLIAPFALQFAFISKNNSK